jgi:hypothetical protein
MKSRPASAATVSVVIWDSLGDQRTFCQIRPVQPSLLCGSQGFKYQGFSYALFLLYTTAVQA